jgi:transposase
MQVVTTVGLDIAKSVFQVHGIDAAGQVVIRRQLKRRHLLAFFQKLPACLVGIEACASSHPGVGPVLATALVASLADPKTFRSGRNFSAWIGLVPKQHSSGGRDRLGSISKQGDRYLRSLFMAGALAVIRHAKIHGTKHRPWLTALLARRPSRVAAIALANKIARMVWAMMAKGKRYKEPVALAA